jgi:hypothetical protein
MDTSTLESKLKWETPWDPTKFALYYPPPRAPRGTGEWDPWVNAMMMDTRLSPTAKVILTRLALHYNLKTGDCFPSHGRIAAETGTTAEGVRSVLRRAAKLGWIERTERKGGSPEKNQSNLYELTLPKEIRDVLNNVGPKLAVTGEPRAWHVSQETDGAVVCGPFKDRANAERWIEDHGPTGMRNQATGMAEHTDRCGHTPITGKGNREGIEHSVSKDTASAAPRPTHLEKEEVGERALRARESSERPSPDPLESFRGYTDDELENVRHGIENFYLDTVAAVVSFAREHGYFLTGNAVGCMIRDGHLIRDAEYIGLPEDVETSDA